MTTNKVTDAPSALVTSIEVWCPEIDALKDPIIGGGFIRAYYAGERPADMDLYFQLEADAKAAVTTLKAASWKQVVKTPRAVTLRKNDRVIQVITFVTGTPDEVLDEFDFTVCKAAAVRDDGWAIIMHPDFFEHLAGRILIFTGSRLPLASMRRVTKYLKRGYSICDENIIALARAVSEAVTWDDEESVAHHTEPMDPDGERRIRVVD